jgi:hypothetical protein
MEKGLVKMKNFANSKNKFGYVYVLTSTGMAEKSRNYPPLPAAQDGRV